MVDDVTICKAFLLRARKYRTYPDPIRRHFTLILLLHRYDGPYDDYGERIDRGYGTYQDEYYLVYN